MDTLLRSHIQALLQYPINSSIQITSGMDGIVWRISSDIREYILKISPSVLGDIRALALLETIPNDVPVPQIVAQSNWKDTPLIIMTICPGVPLADLLRDHYQDIIPSLVELQKNLHTIQVSQPGDIANPTSSWREYLLYRHSGQHPWFIWKEIMLRPGVNSRIVQESLTKLRNHIERLTFPDTSYSLLHTDFNQSNILIDPETLKITGVVDWSEAMGGDPVYDLARIHLLILHFNLGTEVEQIFFESAKLTHQETHREQIYLHSIILDYIAWYSEDDSDFSRQRLTLHHNLLKDWVV